MRKKSLEQCVVDLLQADGWTAQIVQYRLHRGRHTFRDLFGCIDVIAIKAKHPVAGIQVTDTGNFAARVRKVLDEPRILTWLLAGASMEVWGVDEGEIKQIHIFHPHEWKKLAPVTDGN